MLYRKCQSNRPIEASAILAYQKMVFQLLKMITIAENKTSMLDVKALALLLKLSLSQESTKAKFCSLHVIEAAMFSLMAAMEAVSPAVRIAW